MKTYQIIKFQDGDFKLDINISPEEETVWLTKDEIALLFCRDRTVISRHISNIFRENELDKNVSCAKNARQVGGQIHHTTFYNLDVIVAVGYRVKSNRGLLLRTFVNEYCASLSNIKPYYNSEIIIYDNGEIKLPVNISFPEDTVYLNENQIATLFETSRQLVNHHILNIIKDGELSSISVRKYFLHTAPNAKNFKCKFSAFL